MFLISGNVIFLNLRLKKPSFVRIKTYLFFISSFGIK
jgi:hypothetical protein